MMEEQSDAFFLAAFRNGGLYIDGRANHHFTRALGQANELEWSWEHSGSLEIKTGRFALANLYFYFEQNLIIVSSSILSIVKRVSVEFDWEALSVFCRLGYFLDDDTPFQSIKCVPPGSHVKWVADSASATFRTLNFSSANLTQEELYEGTRSEAIDDFVEVFSAAIQRTSSYCSGEISLPVSGGRDSRHILVELVRQGRRPKELVTVLGWSDKSPDAEVAAMLAEYFGIEHLVLRQENSLLYEEREKNQLTNYCSDEHGWLNRLVRHFNAVGEGAVFDGIGGGVLSEYWGYSEPDHQLYVDGKFEELADKWLQYADHQPGAFLRPEFARQLAKDRAMSKLTHSLSKHASSVNPLKSFLFWNRTRREVSRYTFDMFSEKLDVFCPYLDGDVFDLLMSIPFEFTTPRGFHSEAIDRVSPELQVVPYALSQGPPVLYDRIREFRDLIQIRAEYPKSQMAGGFSLMVRFLWSLSATRRYKLGFRPEMLAYFLTIEEMFRNTRTE
jgi:asparagine synthase (glutamine-hydrolysing)